MTELHFLGVPFNSDGTPPETENPPQHLRDAGLLEDRRDGTYVFYRFAVPEDGPWRDAWNLVARALADDPTRERDMAALAQVMHARAARTRSFFDAVGP